MNYVELLSAYESGHHAALTPAQLKFFEFITDHPEFCDHYMEVLNEVRIRHGKKRYSRALIVYKMRYDLRLRFDDKNAPYGIDDHVSSHMARLLTDLGVVERGFFELRKSGKVEREEKTLNAGRWL